MLRLSRSFEERPGQSFVVVSLLLVLVVSFVQGRGCGSEDLVDCSVTKFSYRDLLSKLLLYTKNVSHKSTSHNK